MPDRVNQNVARGAATREHLLTVATALFAERGYEATSIEAVLQEAGVSRGSLYHHFKGKDVLFEAVLEALETDVGRRTMEAAAGATSPKTNETTSASAATRPAPALRHRPAATAECLAAECLATESPATESPATECATMSPPVEKTGNA